MIARRLDPREALDRIHAAAAKHGRTLRFMEVCGTHTVNAFRSGLHSLLPANVRLISGPGCPVCVTSQGEIDQLLELAQQPGVTLCTYGDMLRVRGQSGNLEEARGDGADVRVIYSALDAVKIAQRHRSRQVVFAAVGFETTAPATAVAVLQAARLKLPNFTAYTSHKLIIPAMTALLHSGSGIDGFVCPGHVAVIIGAEAFRPIVERFERSCVVTGFEGPQIAAALARLCELASEPVPKLENLYPQAVSPQGNRHAWRLIEEIFEPAVAHWRGMGEVLGSGLVLRDRFRRFDARTRFDLATPVNQEPPGCRCGEVITGRCTPDDCKLFGVACTPVTAIGPCMVSSEGTCQAWFRYRRVAVKHDRAQLVGAK